MFAGYFALSLSYDRIVRVLRKVFEDNVWPKCLHENARWMLKL